MAARALKLTAFAVRLQIDGLIVNCSAFNPTPSLSAAVVNHFKMRQDVRTYNLSGMGCAASVIGIDLAMELLAVSPFPAHACACSAFLPFHCCQAKADVSQTMI